VTSPLKHRRRAIALQLVLLPALLGLVGTDVSAAAGRMTQSLEELRQREEHAHSELHSSTEAVQKAGAELARVEAELAAAEQALSTARGQLAGAQAKATAARAEADRAERARAKAAKEVEAADRKVEERRDQVAGLARMAYQRGRLGDLREVMQASDPQDALERSEMLRSVFQSGTASIDRVTTARLALAGKRAQLVVEEKKAAAARAEADAQEARAKQLEAEATAAVGTVKGLVADRKSVLADAERLRDEDRRAYEQAQADSAALAEQIRRAEEAARAAAERAAAERRAREAAAGGGGPAAAPQSTGWLWPGYGRLTSRYGWRTHPIYGDRRFHAGIDIGGGYGAPILATESGVVIYAGYARGYGSLVVVAHGGRISSAYGHNSAILVRNGQTVSRGQQIARIGNLGNSTGPHLHFEIRNNGNPVDPLGYVSPP
jgi:murein DD-endopeptidase MepM/ murein hydrolase activator NlpD